MNGYTAIIRTDYRVTGETIYDLKIELLRLADLGLIKVDGMGKQILVVRAGVFVGWMSMSDTISDGYVAYLERATTAKEEALWQLLVDMIE